MTDLIEEPQKPRTRPLGRGEPSVHFLTQSTRPEAVDARKVLNQWYDEFPDPLGLFARRLKSEADTEHYQALDELLTHHLLRRRHSDVRYEEGGAGPDFRVYEKGRHIAAIEVLSLFQREDWTAEERRHARLADALDDELRPTAGYVVHFEIERAEREPSSGRFVQFVRQTLKDLPPHELLVRTLPEKQPRAYFPSAVYEEKGVRVQLEFMPLAADAPSKTDPDARIVMTGAIIGGMVNSGTRLKKNVAAKAGGRYETGDVPFLVLAGIRDMFCSDDQVVTALYGSEAVILPSGEPIRHNDGLFGPERGQLKGRHSRLSAVGIIREYQWGPESTDVAILRNPYAIRRWPDDVIEATRTFDVVDKTDTEMRLDWL